MAYLLYTLTFVSLILITALYFTRSYWLPYIPVSSPTVRLPNLRGYSRLFPTTPIIDRSTNSFLDDAAAGMHSSNFDLSGNIESGDSRQGLDSSGKAEVQRIMKQRGCNFDEARRIVMQERFKREGIGADGRPRDPKFVSFS